MPAPGEITITETIVEAKLPEQEDVLETGAESKKIQTKHTATPRQRKQPEPGIVSEAQSQDLRTTSTPPPSAKKSPASSSKTRRNSIPASKGVEPPAPSSTSLTPTPPAVDENAIPNVPPNVLAAYRTPLHHPLTHGIPVAQLQLRSFSVRNLEFFADFCVRAAYYLSLPCTGPTPLPKKIERWTVLRSNFVNKKAQENFERITMKRLITVYDGAPEVVETWLAFVRRWQFYGVGMKANVWGWDSLGKLAVPLF
jgi:ribosomal protein S10